VGKAATSRSSIAAALETFIRESAQVPDEDSDFGQSSQLFDDGYVDSLAIVALMAFIEASFDVELAEEDLFDIRFATIHGMSGIIAARLPGSHETS
jgi:acyl carrier protein